MLKSAYLQDVYSQVLRRDPDQKEFHQAVLEVLESLDLIVDQHPEYQERGIIESLVEPERMIAFCLGIQAAAPVDSYVSPIPGDMPGYDSQVIMAAGAFVQGSSIELSADGPIRPPYAVYFQGGLTWVHAKLGILMSLQKMVEAGLVNL